MLTKSQFHQLYQALNFNHEELEDSFFLVYHKINEILLKTISNQTRILLEQQSILEYLKDEYLYLNPSDSLEEGKKILTNPLILTQLTKTVSDKVIFCSITPYHPISLIEETSPIISTIELFSNFILNRIDNLRKHNLVDNMLLSMFSKLFLLFKSINYLLTQGFETEAFSTWRTIHELECIITILRNDPNLLNVYRRHIVYNNAFRNTFEDKDEQQKVIDEVKENMRLHDLKSKDMKKYIEYGFLYSYKDINKYPNVKLNFRNGLEYISNLNMYSNDYELSSEVAHSSPLLIFSNKAFFKQLTIVRSYETFFRMEESFYALLNEVSHDENKGYESMRTIYLKLGMNILARERDILNKMIAQSSKNTSIPYKKKD